MSHVIDSSASNSAGPGGSAQIAPIPATPRVPLTIRPATAADIPFIDVLQNLHKWMTGYLNKGQLEPKIAAQNVIVAEDAGGEAIGYCIAQDQYLKRDDVGIIFQLNVAPIRQRQLGGAALVKATFEKAAYGCRLFSCWCAQDLRANWFWEAIGFVPLAFRTGVDSRQRTHIFWQRRIREGDTGQGATPYWFPYQTGSGVMREDRIVLPIPPGTHWRDPMPVLLPKMEAQPLVIPQKKEKPAPMSASLRVAMVRSKSKHLMGCPAGKATIMTAGGVKYIDKPGYAQEVAAAKAKKPPKPRVKNDPTHLAAAREIRDKCLEQFNAGLVSANGKYDVRGRGHCRRRCPCTHCRCSSPRQRDREDCLPDAIGPIQVRLVTLDVSFCALNLNFSPASVA